ncbi:hypothetical protein OpiT1DRAFT_00260 [Opitutaceae bacterium TAV1]|nr:hypothetical protein OpiT1DRAFT_00260 [Opitutaceae bacterium TAV1]
MIPVTIPSSFFLACLLSVPARAAALPLLLLSVAVSVFVTSGCSKKPGDPAVITVATEAARERGAVLFSPERSVYHIELSADRDEGLLTLRTLDTDGSSALETSAEGLELHITADGREHVLILAPVANLAIGELAGGTSRYQGSAAWLKTPGELGVVIESITLRGRKHEGVTATIPAAASTAALPSPTSSATAAN